MNPAALLGIQVRARRGDILLGEALGAALDPDAFDPAVAGSLKIVWLASRAAGDRIHRAILAAEHRPRVLPFRRRTS